MLFFNVKRKLAFLFQIYDKNNNTCKNMCHIQYQPETPMWSRGPKARKSVSHCISTLDKFELSGWYWSLRFIWDVLHNLWCIILYVSTTEFVCVKWFAANLKPHQNKFYGHCPIWTFKLYMCYLSFIKYLVINKGFLHMQYS